MRYKLWDITNNCWYEHGDIYLDEEGQLFCIEELGGYTPYMNKENVTARYEMVRWTGLTDRNGKEIYEGDLGERDGIFYQVVWIEGSASYGVKVIKTKFVLTKGLTFPIQQYVINGLKCEFDIIGNQFENPELINS